MYDWTKWLDHVLNPANRYTVVQNGDGTWTITPAGTVQQQGTPQDQVRFNNIENGIVDAHVAVGLILNYARQNSWEVETGTVVLTNTLSFPFNDSIKTVSLSKRKETTGYLVLTEIVSATGNVGEIEITDKLINGFKIAYTGSAKAVTVKYTVIGGFLK
jgi:hypothetical protein